MHGLFRVAQVKTKHGLTTRPLVKLYPPEQDVEDQFAPGTEDAGSDDRVRPSTELQTTPPGDDPDSRHPTRRTTLKSSQLWRSNIAVGLL